MEKVLIIANSLGFITRFLSVDIEILLDKGYQVECACNTKYEDNNTDEFNNRFPKIKIYDIPFPIRDLKLKQLGEAYLEIFRLIIASQYTLVHVHTTIAAAIVRHYSKRLHKNGTKIVYTAHGFPFYDGADSKRAILYKAIEMHYSKYTDAIITICNEDYENALKMHCKNVYKINGVGIDLTRFDQNNLDNGHFDRNKYRAKLGFKAEDIVLLSIGELNTNKNHQVIIKALSIIENKHIKYAICGRELTEKGKKEELTKLAESLRIDLRFLGFRKDIPEICYCADIGAIPSFKEGLGLSGVEMLAAGIPVVGSKRQGIKDYIINGETGYLANPEDEKSFAEAIANVLNITGVEKNCKSVAKEYDKNISYKMLKSIYSKILLVKV